MPCRCQECDHLDVWPRVPFLDPPHPGGSGEWTVACHWLGPLIDGRATLIRRGLGTDAGSIPQAAWSIVGHPFQMPLLPAFLQHDADYAAELFRRAVCDARLYKFAGLMPDVPEIKRRVILRSVQLCGYESAWRKHTSASVEAARAFCRTVGEEEWRALSASLVMPPWPTRPLTSNL